MKYSFKVLILFGAGFLIAYLVFNNVRETSSEIEEQKVDLGSSEETGAEKQSSPSRPAVGKQKQDFLGKPAHEAIPKLEAPNAPQSYPSEFRQIVGEFEDEDHYKRELVPVSWDPSCDGVVDAENRFPELSERARELGFEGQSVAANDVPIQNWNQYIKKNGFYYQVSVFRVASESGARFKIHLFQSEDPEFANEMQDISQTYPGLKQTFGRAGVWVKVKEILGESAKKGARTVSYRMGKVSTAMYWNGQISYLSHGSTRCQTSASQGKAVCRCL